LATELATPSVTRVRTPYLPRLIYKDFSGCVAAFMRLHWYRPIGDRITLYMLMSALGCGAEFNVGSARSCTGC